ncbi:MAG: ggt, partial [Gemmatimonadetes bacterium]|nr:ggt [Gemmatimonadota bacterium]
MTRSGLLLSLLMAPILTAGCTPSTPADARGSAVAGVSASWPLTGKARVAEGDSAMVVSGSPIASEVGRDVLRQGGNAVDAAVAVGFALLDAAGNPTERSITGHLSAGVPGSVAGLAEAHRLHGRLPWADLVEPAVRLARDGFIVDEYREQSIAEDTVRLARFPASAASYLPGGKPPKAGTRLMQPDLARTLETIRDHGAGGFYRGRVADL